MLLSDPLPINILEGLASLAAGEKAIHIPTEVYGADEYGQAFRLPVELFSTPTGIIAVSRRGRVSRVNARSVGNGMSGIFIIDQTPIPFGGSWDSAEERQFRQWAGLAS